MHTSNSYISCSYSIAYWIHLVLGGPVVRGQLGPLPSVRNAARSISWLAARGQYHCSFLSLALNSSCDELQAGMVWFASIMDFLWVLRPDDILKKHTQCATYEAHAYLAGKCLAYSDMLTRFLMVMSIRTIFVACNPISILGP